ncbi:amino acid ABC transporter permease (plasmid) [Ralstonia sp. 25C]|uniref:amino acid ABC transporter permease n=1 Tax=Ralstonia sp. 25C TaxID=3447363 RepID=UPI003F753BF9
MDDTTSSVTTVVAKPAMPSSTPWSWARKKLFYSPGSTLCSLLTIWLLFAIVPPLLEWLVLKATFQTTNPQSCHDGGGACWAFIGEKYRLILFGTYPYDEQWRPLATTALLIATVIATATRRLQGQGLAALWTFTLIAVAVLMWGGVLGLTFVENTRWGGLPLTLMLSTFGIAFAFPIGIVLALGRRSHMPAIKALCVGYIEMIRGVPLISLLFMSSVMLPLFLPEGFSIDKLLRAQIAIIMFTAAYIAEVVRGGLQSIPKGQYEGAESLGLTYWQQMRKIALPQALKVVIPPLVSTFIALLKDTSLVVIIGIFDLTQAAKAALADPAWNGFGVEAYLFIGAVYFILCSTISGYSRRLERQLAQRQNATAIQ